MNKGKFASLIMLGVFSVGVASSSAVSAQGDINLASVVDNKGASSHDDSVPIDPKVSNEAMVDADEDAETSTEEETEEETQDDSKEEENNASADTEISDKDIEDKADLSKDSTPLNVGDFFTLVITSVVLYCIYETLKRLGIESNKRKEAAHYTLNKYYEKIVGGNSAT